MQILVVISSWGREERVYKNLIKTKPKNWKLYFPSYQEITPNGETQNFVENLNKYFHKHNLKKVVLLGHSLGGGLALQFTSIKPFLIKKLILVDSAGTREFRNNLEIFLADVWEQLINITKARNLTDIFDFEVVSAIKVLLHPLMYLRLYNYGVHLNLEKAAVKLKNSTLIIWGEKDNLTPLNNGRKLQRLIRNSKLLVLKNSHHEWILYYPELLWKELVK